MTTVHLLAMLLSALTFALYSIIIKGSFAHRLVALFWIQVTTYLGFIGTYLVKKHILAHSVHDVEALIFEFTFTNAPLYVAMALMFVGAQLIFNRLLNQFDISLVAPLTQMSLLFTTIGLLFLGDPLSVVTILSVAVVFVGALLTSFPSFSVSAPFGPLKIIPRSLFKQAILEAALTAGAALVTFQCTQKTVMTESVQLWIKTITRHVYSFPFSFFNPFHYNLGVRFFIVSIFLGYLLSHADYRKYLFGIFFRHPKALLAAGCSYFVSEYFFQYAYYIFADKKAVTALGKLSIPFILLFSVLFLKEKLTVPKIVGTSLIIGGGLIALL